MQTCCLHNVHCLYIGHNVKKSVDVYIYNFLDEIPYIFMKPCKGQTVFKTYSIIISIE